MQTGVFLYKANEQGPERGSLPSIENLMYHVIFSDKIETVNGWNIRHGGEEILPTPAELSYALRNICKYGSRLIDTLMDKHIRLYTAHGIGQSAKKSKFDGKLIIAPVKINRGARGRSTPDYDRAVLIDPKLIEQKGFIQGWEVVGEYYLPDGTKQYLSLPIVGSKNLGLGVVNETYSFGLNSNNQDFIPLAFGQSYTSDHELQKMYAVATRIMPISERKQIIEDSDTPLELKKSPEELETIIRTVFK